MGQNISRTKSEPPSLLSHTLDAVRRTRPIGLVIRTTIIGLVALVISGVGHVLFNPVRDESPETAQLVAAISGDTPLVTPVPEELISELGYEPLAAGERLMKPLGSCSTPVPIGPGSFEDACRTHDLGYDLLRYAQQHGQRLGPWARLELDRRLYQDLLNRCRNLRCRTAAIAYYTAVTTNSIRQGYGAPTNEPTTPWVGVVLLVFCLAILSDPRGAVWSMTGAFRSGLLERLPISDSSTVSGPSCDPGRGPGWARPGDRSPGAAATRATPLRGSGSWRYRRYTKSTV